MDSGPGADGKRQRVYFYGKTQSAVRDRLREAQQRLEAGRPAVDSRMPLGAFLDLWLEQVVRPARRPSTYTGYESLIRNRIKPAIGYIKLRDLSPDRVQTFLNDAVGSKSLRLNHEDEPISPRLVGLMRAILRSAMERAVAWRLIGSNPAQHVDPP